MRKKKFIIIICLVPLVICSCISSLTGVSYKYNEEKGYEKSGEEILEFPEGFLWGTATASYQVEGGNINSSWWRFEQQEGRIKNGDTAGIAVDHYNLYKEDIALMNE